MDYRNATQIENGILPDRFERVTEDSLLSGRLGVGGIEYDRALGLEQTAWNTFALVALQKLVGHSGPDYPVHPPFQYCRGLPHASEAAPIRRT